MKKLKEEILGALRPIRNFCTSGIMPTIIIVLVLGTALFFILWNL